jgi:hypothetical protein
VLGPLDVREPCEGLTTLDVPKDISPENAIKLAYDFARDLRYRGAADGQLAMHLTQWVEPFASTPLYRYLRAGFIAGYNCDTLPWRREIEATQIQKRE